MNYDSVVNTLSDSIAKATEKVVNRASFDKTTTGKIIRKSGVGKYIVACFGGEYTIPCSETLAPNQSVAVVAPQGNFNKLMILSKVNKDGSPDTPSTEVLEPITNSELEALLQ